MEPEPKVSADRALLVARTEAVKDTDREDGGWLEGKEGFGGCWDRTRRGGGLCRTVPDSVLASCAGTYGPRSVRFENGTLYYRREGRPEFRLIPMGGDRFMVETLDYFRMQFRRTARGTSPNSSGSTTTGGRTRTRARAKLRALESVLATLAAGIFAALVVTVVHVVFPERTETRRGNSCPVIPQAIP